MNIFRRISRDAHQVSKVAGDLDAARRGPAVLAKRLGRRLITRRFFGALRKGGLW